MKALHNILEIPKARDHHREGLHADLLREIATLNKHFQPLDRIIFNIVT